MLSHLIKKSMDFMGPIATTVDTEAHGLNHVSAIDS